MQVIGRTAELARVCQILSRRKKNNPLLLGEPGVGKTAVAEGLAYIIAKRVPVSGAPLTPHLQVPPPPTPPFLLRVCLHRFGSGWF